MAHDEVLIALDSAEPQQDVTHYKLARMMIDFRRQGNEPMVKLWFERTYNAGGGQPWPEGINLGTTIAVKDPDYAALETATIGAGAVGERWFSQLAKRACSWVINKGLLDGSVVIDETVPDV